MKQETVDTGLAQIASSLSQLSLEYKSYAADIDAVKTKQIQLGQEIKGFTSELDIVRKPLKTIIDELVILSTLIDKYKASDSQDFSARTTEINIIKYKLRNILTLRKDQINNKHTVMPDASTYNSFPEKLAAIKVDLTTHRKNLPIDNKLCVDTLEILEKSCDDLEKLISLTIESYNSTKTKLVKLTWLIKNQQNHFVHANNMYIDLKNKNLPNPGEEKHQEVKAAPIAAKK